MSISLFENTTQLFPSAPFSLSFAASPTASERSRILIVDDSATVRRSFAKILSSSYECFEADSALEAMTELRNADFDLVVTDIIMPGLSGIELLRKIIDEYPDTAVIVISGVDRPQRALDAIRLGAFDYLIKPCDPEVLQLTVERALERRTLLKNARHYKLDLEARNQELVRGKAQLERLQAQIVHSEKMASIGQLAAGIAHELNNPVGFLYGNLDLLDICISDLLKLQRFYDQIPLSDQQASEAGDLKTEINYSQMVGDLKSMITDCRDGAERVKNIVQNLRTFSRLDEAEFKQTDIHEGIESTIRLLSRYFSGGHVALVKEFGDIPNIDAYSAQLNQVWTNLLVNAAQSLNSDRGEVRIKTYHDDDAIYVEVIDNGAGIEPEIMNRIFDPFFTTKAVGEGTGLGLSISFGIIERHRGKIEVRSNIGGGTCFKVHLPKRILPAANTPSVN